MTCSCSSNETRHHVETMTHGTTEVPVDPDSNLSIQEQVNQVLDKNPELLLDNLSLMIDTEIKEQCSICGEKV